jgi:hypothetical protein
MPREEVFARIAKAVNQGRDDEISVVKDLYLVVRRRSRGGHRIYWQLRLTPRGRPRPIKFKLADFTDDRSRAGQLTYGLAVSKVEDFHQALREARKMIPDLDEVAMIRAALAGTVPAEKDRVSRMMAQAFWLLGPATIGGDNDDECEESSESQETRPSIARVRGGKWMQVSEDTTDELSEGFQVKGKRK